MSKVVVEHNEDVLRQRLRKACRIGNRLLLQQIQVESRPITPMKKGYLRQNTVIEIIDDTTASITWTEPYASYQERGRRKFPPYHIVRNYTTPGTGKEFAKQTVKKVVTPANLKKYIDFGRGVV